MFFEICTLLVLFVAVYLVRRLIFKLSVWVSIKSGLADIDTVVTLDAVLNAIFFAIPIALVWFGILHISATIFYGILIEIGVSWIIGIALMSMATEDHDMREMPGKAPFWRRL